MITTENYKIEAGDSSNDYWYSKQPKAQRILQSTFEPTCFALKCKSNSHLMYKCSQESLGLFNAEDLFRKNIYIKKSKGTNESIGFFQVENKTKANVKYGAINNKLPTTSSSSKELLIPLTAGSSKSIDIAMIVTPTDNGKEILDSNNGQHDQKYQKLQRNSSMNNILDKDFNEDKQSLLILKNSSLSLSGTPLSNSLRSSQSFLVNQNASHLRQQQKLVDQKELQSNTTQVKWMNEIENNNLVLHENIYESSNTSLDQPSVQNKNKFPNREKENHGTTDYFHINEKNSQFPEKYKKLPELKEEIKKLPFLSELFIGTDPMENNVTKITTGAPSYGFDIVKSKELAHKEKFGIISETVASNEQDFHKLKMKYDALQLPSDHRSGLETNVEDRGILGKMWSVLQNLCEENQNSQVVKLQGDAPAILFDKQGFPVTDLKGRLLRTKNGEFLLKLSCCKQQIGTSLPIFDAEGINIESIEFDSRKRPAILKAIKVMDLVKNPAELYDRRGYPLTDEEGFVLNNSKGTTLVKLDRKSFPICCSNGSPIYLKNGANWLTQRCKFIIRTFPNLSVFEQNTRKQSRVEENVTDEKNPNLQLSRVPRLGKNNSSQLPSTAGRIPFLANMIFDMINRTTEQDTNLDDYYNTVYNASGEALTDETGFPLNDENGDSLILHNEEGEAISDQFGEPLYNYEGEQITNGWIEIEEYYGESYYGDENTLQVGQYPLQDNQSIFSNQNGRPIIPKRRNTHDWKLYNDHRQPLPNKVVSFTRDEWDNSNETYYYEGREQGLMDNPYQYNYLTTQTLGHRIHFQN